MAEVVSVASPLRVSPLWGIVSRARLFRRARLKKGTRPADSPFEGAMETSYSIDPLLASMAERNASDLHFTHRSAPSRPVIRRRPRISKRPSLTPQATHRPLSQLP